MNLHEDKQQFVTILTFAAQRLQIPAAYIEKDYWVTKILQKLSQSEQADSIVFKGGTSLSKGFRLINRFSEDVDIALLQSCAFNNDLQELFTSDQADLFDVPKGWKTRVMQESLLLTNFSELWQDLRSLYQTELSLLTFADIPNEKLVAEAFLRITDKIKKAI